MAKEPKPTPFNAGLIFGVIKSFLGDFEIRVDRQARIVKIQAKGQTYLYTYDQLVDELENIINGTGTGQ